MYRDTAEVKKMLYRQFIEKQKPALQTESIGVLCGAIVYILQNLREPILTLSKQSEFVKAAGMLD